MLCAKEVSSYLGCVPTALKSSYVTLSLPQVNSSIFLGFIIYCIVRGMSKIPIWRYSGLSGGRRANHTAASVQHCLHGGGFDGCLGLAGHTPVAHVDFNVSCCVLWLLNCCIKYFYKTIKFLSFCLFFFHSNLMEIYMWWHRLWVQRDKQDANEWAAAMPRPKFFIRTQINHLDITINVLVMRGIAVKTVILCLLLLWGSFMKSEKVTLMKS